MTQKNRIADTTVIGGGTAGAAVAGRLAAQANQSVLLVEAGHDYGLVVRQANGLQICWMPVW